MKKQFKFVALAAALVATSVVPAFGADAASGKWKKDKKGSWYQFADGTYAQKEWVGGYWLRANGYWDGVTTKAKWTKDGKGWWYGYKGWFAKKKWQKIDSEWYYFDEEGYALTDQYASGYKFNSDGVMVDEGYGWHLVSKGENEGKWWYGKSGKKGEYVADGWYMIGHKTYHFDEKGYLDTWTIKEIDGTIYAFDSNGNPKAQTVVTPAETIEGSIEFYVNDNNREDAAIDMDLFLTMATEPGSEKVMYVDGVKKTIKHVAGDEDYIAIDDEPLIDYVKRSTTKKVVVTGAGTTSKLFDALAVSGLADGQNYNYKVVIGGTTFSKFAVSDNKMTFTADKAGYKALIDLDENLCYFHNNVTTKGFYVDLAEAGVIDDEKTEVKTVEFPERDAVE